MDSGEGADGRDFGHTGTVIDRVRDRVARTCFPRSSWPFVRVPWPLVAKWLLLLVGFAVQLVLIHMVSELVDLSVSLMEIWAELARKHLEITLA